jgi:hypothetical protein
LVVRVMVVPCVAKAGCQAMPGATSFTGANPVDGLVVQVVQYTKLDLITLV